MFVIGIDRSAAIDMHIRCIIFLVKEFVIKYRWFGSGANLQSASFFIFYYNSCNCPIKRIKYDINKW